MTQDEIIEMARRAGVRDDGHTFEFSQYKYLVAFANFVAAKATEEANARANTSWELMCKKLVAIEREVCAKLCEEYAIGLERNYSEIIADKIRARGEA